MTKRDAIIAYLKETFPPNEVMPPRDYASAVVPVFRVIENYVERQLEVAGDLFDARSAGPASGGPPAQPGRSRARHRGAAQVVSLALGLVCGGAFFSGLPS